jgi:transcriptional regulator with XRE-family HTH domain
MLKGLGWTDHEIARKTKIPQSTITRLKNGLRKNITLQAYTDLLRVAREVCQDE